MPVNDNTLVDGLKLTYKRVLKILLYRDPVSKLYLRYNASVGNEQRCSLQWIVHGIQLLCLKLVLVLKFVSYGTYTPRAQFFVYFIPETLTIWVSDEVATRAAKQDLFNAHNEPIKITIVSMRWYIRCHLWDCKQRKPFQRQILWEEYWALQKCFLELMLMRQ